MSFDLGEYGVDLTREARAGRLDPVSGRDAEIERVVRILSRKTKNNPLLLGEPGVGKTAVVEGLALRMVEGRVPPNLAGRRLFSLNLGSLLAGTGYRGDFEERLRQLIAQLKKPGAARLLFVDEIHLLGRAGKSEGGLDAANLLKPLLARGELPCIGASTPPEWHDLVATDPALERRFQPVHVREPDDETALIMLRGVKTRYEMHHRVEITDDALAAAIQASARIAPERRLPDRAVDLLDEACAMLRLQSPEVESPAVAEAQAALLEAENALDFKRFAQLKYRVLPALRTESRPRLDAATILALAGQLD